MRRNINLKSRPSEDWGREIEMEVMNRRQLVKFGVVAVPSVGSWLGARPSPAQILSRLSRLPDANLAATGMEVDVLAIAQESGSGGSCGGGNDGGDCGSDGDPCVRYFEECYEEGDCIDDPLSPCELDTN